MEGFKKNGILMNNKKNVIHGMLMSSKKNASWNIRTRLGRTTFECELGVART
jgi:hypothetical protein